MANSDKPFWNADDDATRLAVKKVSPSLWGWECIERKHEHFFETTILHWVTWIAMCWGRILSNWRRLLWHLARTYKYEEADACMYILGVTDTLNKALRTLHSEKGLTKYLLLHLTCIDRQETEE